MAPINESKRAWSLAKQPSRSCDRLELAVLILIHVRQTRSHEETRPGRIFQLDSSRAPNPLHVQTLLAFGLVLLDAELLEKHIGSVEDQALGALAGSAGAEEVRESLRGALALAAVGQCEVDGAGETRERRVGGLSEVLVDFVADVVARVHDGDGIGVLAGEADVGYVAGRLSLGDLILSGFLRGGRTWAAGARGLDSGQLAALEKFGGAKVCVAAGAFVAAAEFHGGCTRLR